MNHFSFRRNAIHSPLATLKLLRNFGELISDLQINFALFNIQFCKILEQYLATYCSVSLNFLTLSCNPTRKLFDNIVIPFENVYSIKMESCCFLRSKISYREFFPRLRYLQVDSTRYETRIITNTTIPSIRSLAILDDFEETEISELLKLNSQIEKLLLVSNYSSKLIRRLNNILPNLYCLCLHELPDNFFMDSFEVIQLNNIRVFSMSSTIRLRSIPFEFTKLEHLSILAPLHLNTKWLNQFENMDNLKSIGLFDITGNITGFLDLFNIQRLTDSMNICYKDEMPTRCVDNILILMSSPHPPKKVTITSLPPDFEEFVHNFPIDNSRYDIISYAEAKQIAFKFFSF